MTRFVLACHQPSWLERAEFQLFLFHRRLAARLAPRARRRCATVGAWSAA
jgi:hypothetical protein